MVRMVIMNALVRLNTSNQNAAVINVSEVVNASAVANLHQFPKWRVNGSACAVVPPDFDSIAERVVIILLKNRTATAAAITNTSQLVKRVVFTIKAVACY